MNSAATDLLMFFTLAVTIVAAIFDVARYRIPNWTILGILTIFVALCATKPLGLQAIGVHLLIAVMVLGICFGAFAFGWLGAGDGKLIAVLALVIGPAGIGSFLIITAFAGGALAIVISLLASRAIPVWMEGVGIKGGYQVGMKRVPYGVAIALGAAMTIIPTLLR